MKNLVFLISLLITLNAYSDTHIENLILEGIDLETTEKSTNQEKEFNLILNSIVEDGYFEVFAATQLHSLGTQYIISQVIYDIEITPYLNSTQEDIDKYIVFTKYIFEKVKKRMSLSNIDYKYSGNTALEAELGHFLDDEIESYPEYEKKLEEIREKGYLAAFAFRHLESFGQRALYTRAIYQTEVPRIEIEKNEEIKLIKSVNSYEELTPYWDLDEGDLTRLANFSLYTNFKLSQLKIH